MSTFEKKWHDYAVTDSTLKGTSAGHTLLGMNLQPVGYRMASLSASTNQSSAAAWMYTISIKWLINMQYMAKSVLAALFTYFCVLLVRGCSSWFSLVSIKETQTAIASNVLWFHCTSSFVATVWGGSFAVSTWPCPCAQNKVHRASKEPWPQPHL